MTISKKASMDIILASGSPRRHELLTNARLNFSVMSVDIDESLHTNEQPKDYIERMVAAKANAAIEQINKAGTYGQSSLLAKSTSFIILTADTIGVLPDGHTVLIKPTDREHAYHMWQLMSDATHQVWTAVQATVLTVATDNNFINSPIIDIYSRSNLYAFTTIWQQQIIERTEVSFVPLSVEMMHDYWESGEPADKAGGYGIQGLAAAWVTHINGSYTNIVGLPLAQTLALIKAANQISEDKIPRST